MAQQLAALVMANRSNHHKSLWVAGLQLGQGFAIF
jgi:hypothetical protein